MEEVNCHYEDDQGFCDKYSNDAVVWKCDEDADCKDRVNASPCLTCSFVKYPNLCENKWCKEWMQWYIDRWESLRRQVYGRFE